MPYIPLFPSSSSLPPLIIPQATTFADRSPSDSSPDIFNISQALFAGLSVLLALLALAVGLLQLRKNRARNVIRRNEFVFELEAPCSQVCSPGHLCLCEVWLRISRGYYRLKDARCTIPVSQDELARHRSLYQHFKISPIYVGKQRSNVSRNNQDPIILPLHTDLIKLTTLGLVGPVLVLPQNIRKRRPQHLRPRLLHLRRNAHNIQYLKALARIVFRKLQQRISRW
jgi:hypothetical protein